MKKRILTKGIIIIALNIICLFFSQLSLDAYEPFNLQFKNVVNDNFEITGPMYIPENEERFIRDGDLTVSATLQMNPNSTKKETGMRLDCMIALMQMAICVLNMVSVIN